MVKTTYTYYSFEYGNIPVYNSYTIWNIYGEYSRTHHFSDFENVISLMFSGLTWSSGLSIIIYICNTGYGDMFSSFLSWPGWDPMARLTFGVSLNGSILHSGYTAVQFEIHRSCIRNDISVHLSDVIHLISSDSSVCGATHC